MSNSWFQFRQFSIQQDKTAMKVGTDGILLGAWADFSGGSTVPDCRVLDIGTGTGLIALMAAQRGASKVVAVEIDPDACLQAMDNFQKSPWTDSMTIIQGDFTHSTLLADEKFHHIVCNPPYFRNSLPASEMKRSLARHDESMSLDVLIPNACKLLDPGGQLSFILAVERFAEANLLFQQNGLFLTRKTTISSKPGNPVIRVLAEWSLLSKSLVTSHLSISMTGSGQYTRDYYMLTKDFYLSYE